MALILRVSGKFVQITERNGGRWLQICTREEASEFASEDEAFSTGREVIKEMISGLEEKARKTNAKGGIALTEDEARLKVAEDLWNQTARDLSKQGVVVRKTDKLQMRVDGSFYLPQWLKYALKYSSQSMTTDVKGGADLVSAGSAKFYLAKARGKWLTDGFSNGVDSMLKAKMFGDAESAYSFATQKNFPKPDLVEIEFKVTGVTPGNESDVDPEVARLKSTLEANDFNRNATNGKIEKKKRRL